MRRMTTSLLFLAALTFGVFSAGSSATAGGPGHKEIVATSGAPVEAGHHGKIAAPGSFSLKITKRPSHGTVTIQKSGRISSIVYRSRKGYAGRDDFAYVRIGSDSFAGTYTVGVTVK